MCGGDAREPPGPQLPRYDSHVVYVAKAECDHVPCPPRSAGPARRMSTRSWSSLRAPPACPRFILSLHLPD